MPRVDFGDQIVLAHAGLDTSRIRACIFSTMRAAFFMHAISVSDLTIRCQFTRPVASSSVALRKWVSSERYAAALK